MPCSDISERLELRLDPEDRVSAFSLRKRTCGAGVGEIAELEPLVRGKQAEALLEVRLASLLPEGHAKAIFEFLLAKQLVALQAALGVYLGRESGGADDRFAIASIEYDAAGTKLVGLVAVQAEAAEVSPCGGCSCR
jgi:hypothetical protein